MLKINRKKLKGFLLLLLGIAVGVGAQIILIDSWVGKLTTYFSIRMWSSSLLTNTSPVLGVSIYAVAGLFVLLGLLSFELPFAALPIRIVELPRSTPRFGFWFTSIAISIILAMYARQTGGNDRFGYIFLILWVVAILLLVISVWLRSAHTFTVQDVWAWLKAHRVELLGLGAILLTAFLIRLIDLEFHPYSFINDEGQMGNGGECILDGSCLNFFSLGWADQSRLAFLPYAISIGLFGKTAFAVRLVSVVTGTLAVLTVYLLARELFDRKIAWLSAILLAIIPVHIHFSRTGVDNIIDSVTAPLILWLLFRGAKRNSHLSFVLAGIVTGLCLYTYPGSLLAAMLGVGLLGYIVVRTRGFFRAHVRDFVVFALAIFVVAFPLIGFYTAHSQFFLSRLKSESIVQEAGIPAQSKISGLNAAEILTVQFAKSSLVYIIGNAPGNFFNSPDPYLPAAEAVIFILGMAVMLRHLKDIRYLVIFVWFWAVVIFGSTLTGGAPTSQRLMMSMPALAMIVALAMTGMLSAFRQFYQPISIVAPIILLGLTLYFGYASISYYFFKYRVGHYYEDPTNELTYETGALLAPMHKDGVLVLLAKPESPHLTFGSFNYFSPDVQKYTREVTAKEDLIYLPHNKDIFFLALPDRKAQLELISNWVPGGQWTTFPRRYQPTSILFYSYKITKEQLAAVTP